MIALYTRRRRTVIAGKRLARSFGHWSDKAPRPQSAGPDAPRPGPNDGARSSRAVRRPPGRAGAAPPPGVPDFSEFAPADDTRTRLQVLAQRRDDGELTGEIEEPVDADGATSPSAATRRSLRALAERFSRTPASTPIPPPDPDDALWNRVISLAAPMVRPPTAPPAR